MNIEGLGPSLPPAPGAHEAARRVEPRTDQPAGVTAPDTSRGGERHGAASPAGSPAPPPGTDPELWNVLTLEERAFFARAGGVGPLTYHRMIGTTRDGAAAPPVRGVRVDVRA